jgi:hypothetical protein
MRAFRLLVLATAAAGGVLLSPAAASAHGMAARVEVRADSLHLLAYFDDDTPAESAAVSVVDAAGREVLTGTTDERGECTLPRPAPGRYTLTAKCVGHVAKVEFPVEAGPEGLSGTFSGRRLDRTTGLTIGLTIIFSFTMIAWLLRRRRGYNNPRSS